MRTTRAISATWGLILVWLFPAITSAQTLPPAFRDKVVFSGLTQPTAVAFASDGRVFVTEKSGLIKVFASLSATTPTVFADLRARVHNYWDRGLLGLALHPNFPATPYVYVLYTYDGDIGGPFPKWGPGDGTSDPCPNPPGATTNGCVVSGRLSRLTANGNVWDGSEQVLIHDWFQQFPSHSIGSVVFGNDGALYVSGGEGASFTFTDYGQTGNPLNPGGDPPVGVGGTQTPPTAEGGALRSQDLRTVTGVDPVTLGGSVIRIDPTTGAALPDNPLFSNPDPNGQRIIAEGLRNPFRITARPGTNEIWVGDVGWDTWEEINRIPSPQSFRNFGWPCWEGTGHQYVSVNLNICTDLYNQAGATAPYYTYNHGAKIIPGESCSTGSSSITGLAFYTGSSYPSSYQNALFFADYSRQCIWAMFPNANGDPDPSNKQTFAAGATSPVQLTAGPGGDIFYVDINGGKIHRIQYFLPTAAISANPLSGQAPLTVQLDGSGSTDPDPTETLAYSWDLDGDGVFGDATTAQTSTTFTTIGSHVVTLRVTDTHGGTDTETATIAVNNSPPVPSIAQPLPTLTWKVGDEIAFSGSASDPQDGNLPASALSWTLLMHHCPSDCHLHTIQTFSGTASGSFPAPDHEYPSYLELKLTATDSGGLQATTSVLLYPQTVSVDLTTLPAGLQLSWDATSGSSPLSTTVIVGSQNSLSAASPQVLNGSSYEFVSWSDGGAASHNVTAPASPLALSATFALQPPPSSVSTSPSSVVGGGSSTGTVTLSGPAPGSGAVVALSSSNTPVASVPPGVSIAPGSTSATFAITTSSVASDTTVTISAYYGTGNASASVTVTVPPNVPPTVSLTSPASQATFTAPASILMQASASDSDGTVVRVDFYSGAALLGSATGPYEFTWSNVPAGSYSLTAVATDDRGVTATSTPVAVTVNAPANTLPTPWLDQDVGAVGFAGSASYLSGTFTVDGSGNAVFGTSDQMHFVYQTLSGDGEIVARIAGVQNTNPYSAGGIMIRESLSPDSTNLAFLITGANRLMLQRRTTTGATPSSVGWNQAPPYYVRLVRSGNTLTGYRSTWGTSWTLAGSYVIPMGTNVYVGLFMSSHDNAVLGRATFDHVAVSGGGTPNNPPAVSITSPSSGASFTDPSSIAITATASDSDGTVARVDFYDGGALLGSATSAPYSYTLQSPPAGSHSLKAIATDNLGATAVSATVTISVSYSPSALPSPWVDQDVGAVGLAGSAGYSSGTFTVDGSGNAVFGTSDQMHFVYQILSGDGQIVARIGGVQNTNTYSAAGIMVRDSLSPDSVNIAFLITGANRLMLQRRATTGATPSSVGWNQATPYWLKLVRSGNTLTGYRSLWGTTWTLAGSYQIPMGTNVYVGLFMSSHDNTVLGRATFDHVSVTLGP